MVVKIRCPKCGWVLGDTTKSVDCVINCPKCNAVPVKLNVAQYSYNDYYKIMKGEKIDD